MYFDGYYPLVRSPLVRSPIVRSPLVRSPLVRKSFFVVFDPFSSEFDFDVTVAFLHLIKTFSEPLTKLKNFNRKWSYHHIFVYDVFKNYTNMVITPLPVGIFEFCQRFLKRSWWGAQTRLWRQSRTPTGKGRKSRLKIEIRVIFENILYKYCNNSTSGWNFWVLSTVLKGSWWGAKTRLWRWRRTLTGKGRKSRLKTEIRVIFQNILY